MRPWASKVNGSEKVMVSPSGSGSFQPTSPEGVAIFIAWRAGNSVERNTAIMMASDA